ncbi:hypothetical protein L0V05_00325 [Tabrizicola sp. J26]|uniref:hypothetical protein n=1 Tax=Alitabrizicola rongguiensis TaxID=2909234 RepID=UPI001F3AEB0B|nr:hypothetical protein [Tabrizicola rongguiensis]MCF1707249.1 hypothetical protein [Tabrizicola rongguiensis]
MLNGKAARRLVEVIHRAALDPSCWQLVVDELHWANEESPIALHQLYSRTGQIVTSAASGFDPGYVTTYVEHYSLLSPWIECFRAYPERRALLVSEMGLPADYERGAFYNEWVVPQDIRFGASIRTRGVGSRALIAGISTRARDRDRMERVSQRLLTWLEPHLAHALAVNEEIARLTANSMLKPTDGAMPSPAAGGILIVTTQHLLCWADAGAVPLFGEVVRVAPSGRLGFVDPLIQTWFEVLTAFFDVPYRSARGLGLEIEMRRGQQAWTIRALQCTIRLPQPFPFPT